MNANATLRQCLNGNSHIHCISAESVELRHDQHVAFFHFVEQLRKSRPLVRADTARDTLSDDPALVNGKAGRLDLAELVGRCLVSCADAGVCESSGHMALSSVRKGCANRSACPKIFKPYFRTCINDDVRNGSVSDMYGGLETDSRSVGCRRRGKVPKLNGENRPRTAVWPRKNHRPLVHRTAATGWVGRYHPCPSSKPNFSPPGGSRSGCKLLSNYWSSQSPLKSAEQNQLLSHKARYIVRFQPLSRRLSFSAMTRRCVSNCADENTDKLDLRC